MEEKQKSFMGASDFQNLDSKTFLCSEVEDSSVILPESLQSLFIDGKAKTVSEALTIAVHVLMLEEKFLPMLVVEDEMFQKMPSDWKNAGSCDIFYYHATCPDIECKLKTFPAGKFLVLYGQVGSDDEETTNVTLNLNTTSFIENNTDFKDVFRVYKNLPLLAQSVKDGVIFKLLCGIQQASGIYPIFGLTSLIEEVKLIVLSFLDMKSLVSVSSLNKEFHNLSNHPSLWKRLYCCDFPLAHKPEDSIEIDWKKLYKIEYKKVQDQLKARRVNYLPEYRPIPLPHPPWIPALPEINSRERYPLRIPAIPPEVAAAFPNLARRHDMRLLFGNHRGPYFF